MFTLTLTINTYAKETEWDTYRIKDVIFELPNDMEFELKHADGGSGTEDFYVTKGDYYVSEGIRTNAVLYFEDYDLFQYPYAISPYLTQIIMETLENIIERAHGKSSEGYSIVDRIITEDDNEIRVGAVAEIKSDSVSFCDFYCFYISKDHALMVQSKNVMTFGSPAYYTEKERVEHILNSIQVDEAANVEEESSVRDGEFVFQNILIII